jgi:AcrR family transcriptional regulator
MRYSARVSTGTKPYHHGQLRRAVIDAAVKEVEAVGAAGVSMREIARRAGVSHAAPTHHFGSKAGIFTAIATEGFRLAAEAIGAQVSGPNGFLDGAVAYTAFALSHPGHFEVMFQPDLYDADDPELVACRNAAFDTLRGSARALVGVGSADDVTGLVIAGWSLAHGFATLWLNADLADRLGTDPVGFAPMLRRGLVSLGEAVRRQAEAAGPPG